MAGRTGMGRSLVIGGLLGVLVVAVSLAALFLGSSWDSGNRDDETPSDVLVICVTKDIDGAYVAGVVFTIAADGETDLVDPYERVSIPGTTYDQLRDAYSFGGGEAMASGFAQVSGRSPGAWIVLPAEEWIGLVDDAGGVSVDVPEDVNVFVDDTLYSVSAGEQILSGAEVAAFAVAASDPEAEYVGESGAAISEGLANAVLSSWDGMVQAVESGSGQSDVGPAVLREFGTQAEL